MEIIGIEEVMKLLGCGRPTATRLLNTKGCPTLPRKKGQTFKVEKNAFMAWVKKEVLQ